MGVRKGGIALADDGQSMRLITSAIERCYGATERHAGA